MTGGDLIKLKINEHNIINMSTMVILEEVEEIIGFKHDVNGAQYSLFKAKILSFNLLLLINDDDEIIRAVKKGTDSLVCNFYFGSDTKAIKKTYEYENINYNNGYFCRHLNECYLTNDELNRILQTIIEHS